MGSAQEDRAEAAKLPDGDVIGILFSQHAKIRDMFDAVEGSVGEDRRASFHELCGMLVMHETAEEMVVRPVSEDVASEEIANARNAEEKDATELLESLSDLDTDSRDFSVGLAQLKTAVSDHAEREEHEEFPPIIEACSEEQRHQMGERLRAAEKMAPTRPHPSGAGSTAKQWTVGPFAALIDRVRDAVGGDRT